MARFFNEKTGFFLHQTSMKNDSIKQWAKDERPREKLISIGKDKMSTLELLTILIGKGKSGQSAMEVARYLLQTCGNNLHNLARMSIDEMQKIPGIGPVKAVTIVSAIELGGRKIMEKATERKVVKGSNDVYEIMGPRMADSSFEEFWVLYLNRANHITRISQISEGGVASTIADPRKIFKIAVDSLSSSIILCHNHPSGNLKPSESDLKLTRRLVGAGELLDIRVLDHLIITHSGYHSFADEGQM